MTWKKRTKEEWAEWDRRHLESKSVPKRRTQVRIVGTDTVFPSITACARALKVSPATISNLMKRPLKDSDIQIERFESPD